MHEQPERLLHRPFDRTYNMFVVLPSELQRQSLVKIALTVIPFRARTVFVTRSLGQIDAGFL